MTPLDASLRPAQHADAQAISDLVLPYAEQGIVLPRTPGDILEHVANVIVACDDQATVVGAVALRDFGDGLEEVRSLVVDARCERRGLGSQLVRAALDLARGRNTRQVFTLTMRPKLFERLGFRLVEKEMFPQKVWSDCAACRKRECCDEVALLVTV